MRSDLITGTSLSDRLVSSFPLSLPTAFCFESLFQSRIDPYDKDRVIPNKIDIFNYKELHVNLATLFRNLSSVVNKDVFLAATHIQIADVLAFEMSVIDSLLINEGQGVCSAKYYCCTYDDLYKGSISKYIKMRPERTEWQQIVRAKYERAIAHLLKLHPDEIHKYNTSLKPSTRTDALIITHIPYDLLSYPSFNTLDLLESHTGVLKKKHQWNTKYYPVGDESLTAIPFNHKLLPVFGDKSQIQPMDIRLRRQVLEVAKRRNWVPTTTMDKINYDLSLDIKEPMVLTVLKSL
jgi:hypothetical protein